MTERISNKNDNMDYNKIFNLKPDPILSFDELLEKGGKFSKCSSYDMAGVLLDIISHFSDMTKIEIESITKSVINNDQINESRTARSHLKSIFSKNQDKIPKSLLVHSIISLYLK